jgi:hypothetical protein
VTRRVVGVFVRFSLRRFTEANISNNKAGLREDMHCFEFYAVAANTTN